MFTIHSATTPFYHFIMDQGIKDVFWTNMKHTTNQEPAVSPRSNYSRELSFYDLLQAKWICFTAFSCSFGSLLLKSVLLKHSQCFFDPNEKVLSYIQKFRAKNQEISHLRVTESTETACTTPIHSVSISALVAQGEFRVRALPRWPHQHARCF